MTSPLNAPQPGKDESLDMKTFTLTDRQARLLCWAMEQFVVQFRPRSRGQHRLEHQFSNVFCRITAQLRAQAASISVNRPDNQNKIQNAL